MSNIAELMADADRRANDTNSPEISMYWRGRKDAFAIVLKLQQREYENSYEPSYVQ